MINNLLLAEWNWGPGDNAIALTAVLTTLSCSLIGWILVLRRNSLMGDAISHAVLPGLVIAYLISNSLSSLVMLIGAVLAGLAATWLMQLLQDYGRVAGDSSMGIVFSTMFALGVVMLRITTGGDTDLDADCVLQGSLSSVGQDTINVIGLELPRAAILSGLVCCINAGAILLFWKEFQLSTFDAQYAEVLGFRPRALHYLLMTLTALTAVAAFQAVGTIMVIALLIVPATTARFLTDRLGLFVLITVLVGLLGGVIGVLIGKTSVLRHAEPAAVIAVCLVLLFIITAFVAPRYGIISHWRRKMRQTLVIQGQDLLAMMYRLRELAPEKRLGTNEIVQALGGGWLAGWALRKQRRAGLMQPGEGGWELTSSGVRTAARLVRTHRLWEAWLVRYLGLPLDHLHAPAERMEHYIDEVMEQALQEEFSSSTTDPHGREIPR